MGCGSTLKLEVTEYVLGNFIGLRSTNGALATLRAHFAPKPGTCITGASGVQGMGDIVNLRMARKRAKRELAERNASANRLLHGRSKTERELEAERDAKARRDLERHRIETGDER